MPYVTNADLSQKISEHLPEHAQTIFRKAFNNAYAQYHGDEEIAFRIAWTAVKKKYEKSESGQWVAKNSLSCGKCKKSTPVKRKKAVKASTRKNKN